MNKQSIDKKIAVISGGFGSLGWEISNELMDSGYFVVVLSRHQPKEYANTNQRPYSFISCDISKPAQVSSAIMHITHSYGHIDLGIHCASSGIIRKRITDITAQEFAGQFDVNVFGAFNLLQSLSIIMKNKKHGSLMAITTEALTKPQLAQGSMAGYIAAKYALQGFLRELAKELLPFGIMVNAIAPGFTYTGLNSDIPEQVIGFLKEKAPHLFKTTPKDTAEAVTFLLSKRAAGISGQQIATASHTITPL